MNISNGASVSGMQAASLRQDVAAHNIANVNTPDFRDQRAEQVETARGGEAQAPQSRDTFEAGTGTQAYDAGRVEQDLAREMTNMIENRNSQAANAAAARTQDEVSAETIDLVG